MGNEHTKKRNPSGAVVCCPQCGERANITQNHPQNRVFSKFHARCHACSKEFSGYIEITHWLEVERKVTETPIQLAELPLGIIRKRRRKPKPSRSLELFQPDTAEGKP